MQRRYNNSLSLSEEADPLCYQMHDMILREAYGGDDKDVPTEESLGDALRKDPGRIFELAGLDPDPWQLDLLRCEDNRVLTLCSRQSGKSLSAAAMAVAEALGNPPAEILILSKAQRQSKEVLRKAKSLYLSIQGDNAARLKIRKSPRTLRNEVSRYNQALQRLRGVRLSESDKTQRDNTEIMEFKNGSRIISLPGTADTIVGFSGVSLLIIDEAARTPDQLFAFLSPTRATTEGKLVAFTTPFGKRGWFYEAWIKCEDAKARGIKPPWKQISIRADQCPRISKDFLADERFNIGDMWYRQEYECNPPEAPVWMGDFSFQPIGNVKEGDVVIGWRDTPPVPGMKYGKETLCRSVVLGVRKQQSALVDIHLESGKVIRCTPSHKWSTMSTPRNCVTRYAPARTGYYLCKVIDPTPALPDHLKWDAAWLGGIYDGEGCGDHIAQSKSHNPQIHARIESVLAAMGFRSGLHKHGFYFMGQDKTLKKQAMVDFINWTRPTKVGRFIEDIILCKQFRKPDRIVKITPAGCGEVVCMQTNTGNYVVWGYASKNCSFLSVVNSVFDYDDIQAALDSSLQPLMIPGIDTSLQSGNGVLDSTVEQLEVMGVDE